MQVLRTKKRVIAANLYVIRTAERRTRPKNALYAQSSEKKFFIFSLQKKRPMATSVDVMYDPVSIFRRRVAVRVTLIKRKSVEKQCLPLLTKTELFVIIYFKLFTLILYNSSVK